MSLSGSSLEFDSYIVSYGGHMGIIVGLDDHVYYVDVSVGMPTYIPVDVTQDT
jgi:hypothetical protein